MTLLLLSFVLSTPRYCRFSKLAAANETAIIHTLLAPSLLPLKQDLLTPSCRCIYSAMVRGMECVVYGV